MASRLKTITKVTRLNPILKVILQGVIDTESPFSMLRGMPHILKMIWRTITSYWKKCIEKSDCDNLSYAEIKYEDDPFYGIVYDPPRKIRFNFPEPRDLNINMMPFIMADTFRESRLPNHLNIYFEVLIKKCIKSAEIGKVGYLTIHEGAVKRKTSQRRPGIHTESPGVVLIKGCEGKHELVFQWGNGSCKMNVCQGGIYMASSVDDSCEVWDCRILQPKDGPKVIGELGDIEHLREFLPKSEVMQKNMVYWITDRTPHESLPLKRAAYRQYFRLVTSEVSIWYADHSTRNPLGVVPDNKITKIVKGSKFDKAGVVLSG